MKIKGGMAIFSTGKERYANRGIIGLSPDGEVSEGYNGGFWNPDEAEYTEPKDCLTPAELVELADYMIAEWTRFRARHSQDSSREKT